MQFEIDELDLSHFVLDKSISPFYQLFAVIYHHGNIQGGHYTAACYNPVMNKWYYYDDSRLKEFKEEEIVN